LPANSDTPCLFGAFGDLPCEHADDGRIEPRIEASYYGRDERA
jgi:hypothetical protein